MYKLILATRYLLKRRITYFAVLAVALCVFIVVVVMTVMAGLVGEFKQKNHDFSGDCVVGSESLVGFPYYEDYVKKLDASELVEGVSEVIRSYGLLSLQGRDRTSGVEIMGLDPARHSRATGFGDTLYHRRDDIAQAFVPSYDANLPGCILGIDLALERDPNGEYAYDSSPRRIGFSISCFPLTARGALAGAGTALANTKTFYYSDHSHSGLARVDDSIIYLPFDEAQALCGMSGQTKRINAIHVKFKPDVPLKAGCEEARRLWSIFKAEKANENQAYLLDTVTVQDWKLYGRALIAAMEKEQLIMGVMFGFVGIVTVFIVLVVFYMLISHKSKDIGVLRSIGVSGFDIIELFSGFALMVGLAGSSLGVLGGWQFLLRINSIERWLFEHFEFQVWDRTMFAIGDIPSAISPRVLAMIVLLAIAACLIGALVPSWQAARLKPAETLQVNQL